MSWPLGPAEKYGGSFIATSPQARPSDSVLPSAGGPSVSDGNHPLSPNDPLFWVFVIGAVAVGFMYASTTVRVGPVKASVSAGKS
jgi:hypothetical protein